MNHKLTYFLFLIGCSLCAQTEQEIEKENAEDLAESTNLTWEANKEISEDNFIEAETGYRRAISKSDKNAAAPFNLGTAYYEKETYSEAFGRFKEAGEIADAKPEKHKAFHNMGNVFMKRKEYEKAVEAYKEALRNNPKDEETRYNLALAKEMLKKEEDEQKQNDENKDDKDQEDKKDEQEKNQDQNEDGDKKEDEGDQKEDENEEKNDEGDKGDQEKEENKEGDGDKKEEQEKKPEEQQQPPRPNQLSKQQIQNLLDAMQNEENKVQEKIDAQKVKGVKVKNEKDW